MSAPQAGSSRDSIQCPIPFGLQSVVDVRLEPCLAAQASCEQSTEAIGSFSLGPRLDIATITFHSLPVGGGLLVVQHGGLPLNWVQPSDVTCIAIMTSSVARSLPSNEAAQRHKMSSNALFPRMRFGIKAFQTWSWDCGGFEPLRALHIPA